MLNISFSELSGMSQEDPLPLMPLKHLKSAGDAQRTA